MNIKSIEEYYKTLPDYKLISIATTDAKGLGPEVYRIIEKEIIKRRLNPDILLGINAQNKEYSKDEIEHFSNYLRDLPCPICGNTNQKLNGTVSHTIKSFLIFSINKTIPTIACPTCLDKKNNDAIISTAILGWWGIPMGVIMTPIYINRNIEAKKENRLEYSNNALLEYTLNIVGEIEAYKNNKEKLKELIKQKK